MSEVMDAFETSVETGLNRVMSSVFADDLFESESLNEQPKDDQIWPAMGLGVTRSGRVPASK